MAAIFHLTTGVVYVRGWSGTVTGGTTQAGDGSAAAPSYSFTSRTDTGRYRSTTILGLSNALVESVSGTAAFVTYAGGVVLPSASSLAWANGVLSDGAAVDLSLFRDAANILAQRNGTNAQTFRVGIAAGYVSLIGSADHSATLSVFDNLPLYFGTNNTNRWKISESGHLTGFVPNTYDIVDARTGYFGTSLFIGTNPASGGLINIANNAGIRSRNAANSADITLLGADTSDRIGLGNFSTNKIGLMTSSTVAIGGFTSSFPGLKANGAVLEAKLADDSAYASFALSKISTIGGVATEGNLGVMGVVKIGRAIAQTAAVASVAAYTVGSADESLTVSANVLVTTSTTHNFTVTVAYTDEGNTARTLTLPFSALAGTIGTSIANAAGAVPYEGVSLHIRAKTATTVTIATTGTFTTVTYNVEGIIQRAT